MTDKLKDPASSLPPAEDSGKKIAIGKPAKGKQIIINPPEKVDTNQGGIRERFQQALQKHTVILEKKTELVLQSKAARADLPEEVLKQVFIRGYKNLPLNTDLTREQYAMNRVNSFVAGGAALQEDYDLIPIMERIGMKGTGGAMRPHIKAERNVYNGKMVYHVVDAKGQVKHTAADKFAARKHLAQKYQSYMREDALSEVSLGNYKEKASQQVKELKPFVKGEFGDIAKRAIERRTKGLKMAIKREEVEVEEGLQQKLRKIVPGYAKRQINKKMDDQKFGRTDVDKDANYYRYKKVLDKANEEVELDEISTDGYYKAAVKSRMNAAVKVASTMGKDKQAVTKLNARNAGMKRVEKRTQDDMKKANSGPQKPVHREPSSMSSPQAYYASKKPGEYTGDSYEPRGQMIEAKSAAVRFQLALQNAKKKREEEEARNAENVKRALTPREPQDKK